MLVHLPTLWTDLTISFIGWHPVLFFLPQFLFSLILTSHAIKMFKKCYKVPKFFLIIILTTLIAVDVKKCNGPHSFWSVELSGSSGARHHHF
jgi:hypothetical protein